ncbi:MAG: hypothetical protein K2H09_01850 [Treponemataceae bacterium]|nr:hypothetical protein [Treponemataceae bacterium]
MSLASWGGGTKGFYDVAVFSEGLLSRFGTVYGNYSTMMFGAAMDFDVRMSNLFSYADYGLGVVCKQQAEFPRRISMDWSAGASWMFLGAGDFYELYQGIITHPDDGVERRLYDFSTGVMAKCRFKISQPAVGTFGASFLCAAAFTIGAAVPPKGSSGSQFIGMLSASYEHDILKNYSLGVAADWYFKKGFYDDAADVFQNVPQVSLFGRYCIK